ncbi:MAG TPA: VCBS repeat-containing protein, partial [Candidatus Saccharimonadales bacterium]|nr:VCBS repeat-containing protein [Candidatus Saccharimonadales bacterium]
MPSSSTGISFTNQLSLARQLRSSVLLDGAGVAAGDVDGDGLCDLYFCGLDNANVLYRNLGNMKFQDITAEAGVAMPNIDPTAAAFADIDGDGDLDLIVNTTGAGTHVFINDGKGHFQLAGTLNPGKGGTSMALADVDGDGFLDLYVANYRTTILVDMPQTYFRFKETNGKKSVVSVNGRPVTDPDLADRFTVNERGGVDEQGEADVLFRNLGGTNIVPVSFTGGAFLDEDGKPLTRPPMDWGLSVMMRDFNGDGLPDIYVCNDFDSPDRLWINKGNGRFQAIPRTALRRVSLFSMGVDVADINRDGYDDIFTLDMLSRDHVHRLTQMPDRKPAMSAVGQFENRPQYTMNMLFLGHADGTYTEIAQLAGVAASEWSWTPLFLDVDLDGWEDLLVGNGHARDARNLDIADRLKELRTGKQMTSDEILAARKIFPSLEVPKLAFRNRHDLTFEEVGKQWGFDTVAVSHGMALADLDNDGDLDVVVNNLNGPAGVYRNDTIAPRITVRLNGQGGNTKGVGARIKVLGGPVTQTQEIICGGRYLSSDEPTRSFAAGSLTNELTIEVMWRSGKKSVVSGAHANRLYLIEESGSEPVSPKPAPKPEMAFEDVSSRLHHVHADEPFNDFERQPLLMKRLSQLGPGVAWADIDGDGSEDLIVASGKGGQMGVFQNDGRGAFKPWNSAALALPIMRDQTTVLALPKAPGQVVLLAGSANYEDGLASGACVRTFDLKNGTVEDSLPPRDSSTGPMALADLNGDGILDLFVGGRVIAGKFPEAASSAIFRGKGGSFELDVENTKALAGIGMVSGAVFSDLDGDGAPDLLLACD